MNCRCISSKRYLEHKTGLGHPECPERITAILNVIGEEFVEAREATEDELQLCHTKAYIDLVKRECAQTKGLALLSTGDAVICPKSYEIAKIAVGGALIGVDIVANGEAKSAFCAVRPPGHHACSDKGMGFCLFNNVAIAARYAQKTYGYKKILIVDWDVHHGNGTEEIFFNDPSVFYFSTHAEGIYPGTGNESTSHILNCPVNTRDELFEAFTEKLVPEMERFRPDFVFISAGFDAHYLDPIGTLPLRTKDFAKLTTIVKQIAGKYADGRIVSVLEGGYHLGGLAASSVEVASVF